MPSEFNDRILDEVRHRPWPMPRRPWIMTQTWHDLLFAHWRVDPAVLRPRVPAELALDVYDGGAWVGIVPFHMTNVAPRGLPALPWLSAFPELNVRTYVRAAEKAGVYFFSLDARNTLAVLAARTMFGLPYFPASMRVVREDDAVHYSSRRVASRVRAELQATYRPVGPPAAPEAGSLEHFLTERYCLFTVDRRRRVRTVDIHHPPWPLQRAEAAFAINTMADAAGIRLPGTSPLLHYARRQDVVVWAVGRA
jgi:uncharacterized protein YqjF (DUF2071 family)